MAPKIVSSSRCYNSVRQAWLANYSNKTKDFQDNSMLLPKLNPILDRVQKISIYYMFYIIFKGVFSSKYTWLEREWNLPVPTLHCIFLGRSYMINQVEISLFFYYCTIMLSWWCIQHQNLRSLDLNLMQFLHQRYEEIMVNPRKLKYSRDQDQLFIRKLICYKVRDKNHGVIYKIRPNRTLHAKYQLERRFTIVTLIYSCFYITSASIITIGAIVTRIWDSAYVESYPGCAPELELRLAAGELGRWSTTWTAQIFLARTVDFIQNTIFWANAAFTYFFVIALAYILNNDLMYYWSQIHLKSQILEAKLSLDYQDPEANYELRDLQCQINDFFKQLRAADLYISDTLTLSVQTSYFYAVLVGIKSDLQIFQISALAAALVMNLNLLKLSRMVNRSYGLICSLMAKDTSIYKEKFIIILELYSKQYLGPYYSLMRFYTYPIGAFASLLGGVVSTAIVCENLYNRYMNTKITI